MNFKEKIQHIRSQNDAVMADEHGQWFSAYVWANVFGISLEEAVEELRDFEAQGLVSVWCSEYSCVYVGRGIR